MSAMSEKARSSAKAKVTRMTAKTSGAVDASGWKEPTDEKADVQTGERPVSRRAFKSGGKVHGEKAKAHADRKPRKSGGSLTADSLINRNVKSANEERDGEKHVGGFKKGGRTGKDMGGGLALPAWSDATTRKSGGRTKKMVGGAMSSMRPMARPMAANAKGAPTGHPMVQMRAAGGKVHEKACRCEKCGGGAVGKASGGSASNAAQIGARPEGGRTARASGGRTKKGAMNVNIIIAPAKDKPAMPPMGAMPPPMPPGGPPGLHQGAPPPPPPAGAAPPMGPMGRKSGGKVSYPIDSGAGGGLGRLEKARAYG